MEKTKKTWLNVLNFSNILEIPSRLTVVYFTTETRATIKLSQISIHAIAFGSCFFFSNFKILNFNLFHGYF